VCGGFPSARCMVIQSRQAAGAVRGTQGSAFDRSTARAAVRRGQYSMFQWLTVCTVVFETLAPFSMRLLVL
jgi:hypothetical protein